MTDKQKLAELLQAAILGVKKHKIKNTEYDKGMFHAFQTIRNKWHELNEHQALPRDGVVERSEQLVCSHCKGKGEYIDTHPERYGLKTCECQAN